MKFIPYGRQDINQEDINAVIETLESDFLTQGPKVAEFEETISKYCNVKYTKSFNSATSALHCALLALGVTEGDMVWTSPITFVASSNSALYCGASVEFSDINPDTFNMCPDKLEEKLKIAKSNNKLPKVVIPVHMSGQSCDMEKIKKLSDEYGFKTVEDASHCIGASYKNKKVGSCEFSDMTIFSFHPVKIITTGEGGAATTNDPNIKAGLDLYCSHGITRDKNLFKTENDEPWYYQQVDLGFNYRLTDVQAALGISQFKRLDKFIDLRNEIASKYYELLDDLPINLPKVIPDARSSFHLFIIRLEDATKRRQVFEFLRSKNIGVNVHYIPVNTQPYYTEVLGSRPEDTPLAQDYYSSAITLPLHPNMTDEEIVYIKDCLKEALS